MLIKEFTDRTGFYPTADEYKAIEKLYYDYDGDKDAFCKYFKTHKTSMLNKAHEIACASFEAERETIEHKCAKQVGELLDKIHVMEFEFHEKECEFNRINAESKIRIEELEQNVKYLTNLAEARLRDYNSILKAFEECRRDRDILKHTIKLLKEE